MTYLMNTAPIFGTVLSEVLGGTVEADFIVGLDGNDQISGGAGDDILHGDFIALNLLQGTQGASSFAQYDESDAWNVEQNDDGFGSMTQTIQTALDATYSMSFELAANYGAGSVSGEVEILWNGEVIHSFDTNSATFSAHDVSFKGTGGPGELTFRSIASTDTSGPEIHTDGPVFWYETEVEIGGIPTPVKAIAEGQSHIYQVMDGTLHTFDVSTETYRKAGVDGSVNVNALGFNQEDDLLYGIAVSNGRDSQGNKVKKSDLVTFDAEGDSYVIGSTPYRSWTGDFDASGNLWVFNSSMDWINMIDVDQIDTDGVVQTQTYKLPRDMVKDSVWDVAFDAETQTFTGMVKPSAEGAPSKLLTIDISQVATGGAPIFNTLAVTHTIIDGESHNGVPFMTFGAAIHDADGNLYVGGNGGDHDMNNGTHTSGAIYRVIVDETAGTAYLELVADAPRARSNDGAADPRAMDPFTQVDKSANILIRSPEVTPELPTAPEDGPLADTGYDDLVHGGAGKDTIYGDIGHDTLIGDTHGDTLLGEDGDDFIFGGAGPNWKDNGLISVYDDDGNRFDQFGNPLPEDDDMLFGGAGDDYLSGSAGHDTLDGGIGSDELSGGSGDDTLYGGVGDDTLSGGGHDDVLFGGEGNDLLHGGSGDNKLFGGVGDDEMLSGAGADYHDGGEGNDTMSGGNGNDELIGGRGNDVLRGGSDDDKLDGGAGDDKLDGGTGDDAMYGGAGNDSLKAGSGNDLLIGGEGNDYLAAWKGDDKLDGGAGNDRLYMGAGNDVASGGTGNDRFIYRADDLDGKRDTILDFRFDEHEQDTLDFRGLKLLDSGIDETTWRNNAVSRTDKKTVKVDLGQCTIELIDQFGAGDEFLNQVMDAVLFA